MSPRLRKALLAGAIVGGMVAAVNYALGGAS